MQIGIRRKESSRVLPSENITSPEMKEPANARQIAPKMDTNNRARNCIPVSICRFRKMIVAGIRTHSINRSSAVP